MEAQSQLDIQSSRRAGENLRRWLDMNGLSQRQVATAIGMDVSQLNKAVNPGDQVTSLKTLAPIANEVGLEVGDLTGHLPVRHFGEHGVPCGPPSPLPWSAQPTSLIRCGDDFGPPERLFAVTAQGESMIAAGILPGDVLIFDSAKDAAKGDIVLLHIKDDGTGEDKGVTVAKKMPGPHGGYAYMKCDGGRGRWPKGVDIGVDPRVAGVLVGQVRKWKA